MAGAHKLDVEKTICHGRYLDAVLGWFGGVSLKGFHVGGSLVEVATHLFLIFHGWATSSLVSSAYNFTCGPIFLSFFNCKTLFLLFWVFFFFFFWRECGVVWFYGFFVCLFPKKILGLWVAGNWVGYCVYGFVSRVYLWFGFSDLFFGFLVMEIGFGCWIWIWGLLEIGLVASWTWQEHEQHYEKKKFNCFS